MRSVLEPRLGGSLAGVVVDATDQGARRARAHGARGLAEGKRVSVDRSAVRSPSDGNRLLIHELAHVLQQSGGTDTLSPTTLRVQAECPPDCPVSETTEPESDTLDDEAQTCPTTDPDPVDEQQCEVPSAVDYQLAVRVPDLNADGGTFTTRLDLGGVVLSSSEAVLYAVPIGDVFETPEHAAAPTCDPDRDTTWIGRPGSTAHTPEGPIEVFSLTSEYVITPTYTRFAVGAGSAALARTAEGLLLIDAGVEMRFGGPRRPGIPNMDLAEALADRIVELAEGEPIRRVLLTHRHADHINALPVIAEKIEIQSVQIGHQQAQHRLFRQVMEATLQAQERYRTNVLPERVRTRMEGLRADWLSRQPTTLRVDDARAEAAWRAHVEQVVLAEQARVRANPTRVFLEITLPEGTPALVEATLTRTPTEARAELPTGTERGGTTTQAHTRGSVVTFGHPDADVAAGHHPDAQASNFAVRLANGDVILIAGDPRDRALSESVERFRAALDALGHPAETIVVEVGHHAQRGWFTRQTSGEMRGHLVEQTWVNDATQMLAEILARRAPDGSLPRGALVAGGAEARISPAHAWLARALGYEAFITTADSAEIQLLDVFDVTTGERLTVLEGVPRGGGVPGHQVLFEASMERVWLQGQIRDLAAAVETGDPEAVAESQRLETELQTLDRLERAYIDRFNLEIGRGDREPTRPAEAPPEGAGEVAPSELAALEAHLEVVAELRPPGQDRIQPRAHGADASTVLVLADQAGGELTPRQQQILEHTRGLSTIQRGLAPGEVPAGEQVAMLGHIQALAALLEAQAGETPEGSARDYLLRRAAEHSARAEAIRGAVRVTARSRPDPAGGGRSTTEVVAQAPGEWSPARHRLESGFAVMGPVFGTFMIAHSVSADQELAQRIESGDASAVEALAGTLHNVHGVSIGIRMVSLVPVSLGEFALLAVWDVAATMARDYETDEDWWIASMSSAFQNAINLACFALGSAMMKSGNPWIAAAGFGVMVLGPYVVGPVLDWFGLGPQAWERWFSFDPNDVVEVEQELRDLMTAYRISVGALKLARTDLEVLRAMGSSDPESLVDAATETADAHRADALAMEDDILEAFETGYQSAAQDHHGLMGLDLLREQFVALRAEAHGEGADDAALVQAFRAIERSIDLTDADPADIRAMEQWRDIHSALDDLHYPVFHHDDPDAMEIFEDLHDIERMLDHARYRLHPAAPDLFGDRPVLRATPLLQPGPARDAYEGELLRAERRFSRFLVRLDRIRSGTENPVQDWVRNPPGDLANAETHEWQLDPDWQGPARRPIPHPTGALYYGVTFDDRDATGSTGDLRRIVQFYAWQLEEVVELAQDQPIDALWASSAGIERRFDDTLSAELRAGLSALWLLERQMELNAGQARSLALLDADLSTETLTELADLLTRARTLVDERRHVHGLIFRDELRTHAREVRAVEETQLATALDGAGAAQLDPMSVEALDEMDHTDRVSTVAGQLQRLRLESAGGPLRIFSLQESPTWSGTTHFGIRTDPDALVGYTGSNSGDDLFNLLRGHYQVWEVVPLTRQAISQLGTTDARNVDSRHLVPVHITDLLEAAPSGDPD